MSAVGQYVYAQLVTEGVPEVAEALRQISMEEMHHLKIFGTLAQQLGADPRLWSVWKGRHVWWTPGVADLSAEAGTAALWRHTDGAGFDPEVSEPMPVDP